LKTWHTTNNKKLIVTQQADHGNSHGNSHGSPKQQPTLKIMRSDLANSLIFNNLASLIMIDSCLAIHFSNFGRNEHIMAMATMTMEISNGLGQEVLNS
jgi:hypothetical protein